MNTKTNLLSMLTAGMFLITSCNNGTTTTTEDKTDSAANQTVSMEDTANKMQSMNMDNGLMTSMNAMMDKMSSMKMSGDFDKDFATMMIEHHQGAIDMSKIEIAKGTDEKIKGMAQTIIAKQTEEINKLQQIIKNLKKSDMKMGEGVLEKSMSEMKSKMSGMQMTGNTDKDFATMMISHHEGAVAMSKAEVANGMNAQLKQLAQKGINDAIKEIGEFKSWLSANK